MKLKVKKILFSILALSFIPIIFIGNGFNSGKVKNGIVTSNQTIEKDLNSNYTIKQLISGYDFSGAVIHDINGNKDHLFMWGLNETGQLGYESSEKTNWSDTLIEMKPLPGKGYYTISTTPQEVKFDGKTLSSNQTISQVSLGMTSSAAVIHDDNDNKDHLYTWGNNAYGQLDYGEPDTKLHVTPTEVKNLDGNTLSSNQTISHISVGSRHTVAVIHDDNDNKDHLYTWGNNGSGQLGRVTSSNDFVSTEILKNSIIGNDKITQLSTFKDNTAFVLSDSTGEDKLFSWGDNTYGQLGHDHNLDKSKGSGSDKIFYNETPQTVILPVLGKITQLAVTSYHSAIVINNNNDNKDHLYTWGRNGFGELGRDPATVGTQEYNPLPTEVLIDTSSQNKQIIQLSLGVWHSGAVVNDETGNHIYMWGRGYEGQLGSAFDLQNKYNSVPTEIFKDSKETKQISLGGYHSVVAVKNHISVAGVNTMGQFGNGEKNKTQNPIFQKILSVFLPIDIIEATPIVISETEIDIEYRLYIPVSSGGPEPLIKLSVVNGVDVSGLGSGNAESNMDGKSTGTIKITGLTAGETLDKMNLEVLFNGSSFKTKSIASTTAHLAAVPNLNMLINIVIGIIVTMLFVILIVIII